MSEFALIDAFVRCFDVEPSPFGPGDDCAVVGARRASVVTTDAVFEHVHFTRPAFSFADIGHKALAVNLSDLAAMGARPDWFTVALGIPPRVTDAQVVQLGEGMSALARIHGAKLIGGNVKIKLKVENDPQYGDRNQVNGFASISGAAPLKPAASAPAPAAKSSSAPPWAR